jgi:hypothetical protein
MNTDNTKIVVRANSKFRYLDFLKDVKMLIDENKYISFNDLAEKHKIARGQLLFMTELNIIKKISPKNFKWIGRKPSLEMANLILECQRKKYSNINKPITNIPRPKAINVFPEKIKPKYSSLSFSLFWGLIKIQKT